jgi:serine/threonine protein kinase
MNIVEVRIGQRYRLSSLIGKGLFSEVFEGENVYTGERVAIKLEDSKIRYQQVNFESQILKHLQGGLGIPIPYWCGQEGDYNCLVMELLGDSLGTLKQRCKGKFSLKTTLMLADQLLTILEFIHSETIVHRDLKLENILMGIDNAFFQVHLIDFGLSKRFIDPSNNKHIPMKTGKTLLGSVEYASIPNHNGKELSRRDDMESLAYILCHMLMGDLPWSNLVGPDKAQENEERVLALKMRFSESESLSKLPQEFKIFLDSSKSLSFEDEPKYLEYRRMFKELMVREGHSFDYIYDWILIPASGQVAAQLNAIDDLLDIEDALTKEEEAEIAALMQKYESDPTVMDYRLEDIRKQNKKFDVISPTSSPKASMVEERRVEGGKGKKGEEGAGGKKGKGGKGDNCLLI